MPEKMTAREYREHMMTKKKPEAHGRVGGSIEAHRDGTLPERLRSEGDLLRCQDGGDGFARVREYDTTGARRRLIDGGYMTTEAARKRADEFEGTVRWT